MEEGREGLVVAEAWECLLEEKEECRGMIEEGCLEEGLMVWEGFSCVEVVVKVREGMVVTGVKRRYLRILVKAVRRHAMSISDATNDNHTCRPGRRNIWS